MICDHPQCNGRHDQNTAKVSELCPEAARRIRDYQRYYYRYCRRDSEAYKRYRNSLECKLSHLRWRISSKGMLFQVRDNANRRKTL